MGARFLLGAALAAAPPALWADAPKPAHTLQPPGVVTWVALTPDSKHLLTANDMVLQTRREFMTTSSLSAAGLPVLAVQEELVEVQVWTEEQLLHMGWHCIYLLRYFAGEPLWCSARVTQGNREITLKHPVRGRERTACCRLR